MKLKGIKIKAFRLFDDVDLSFVNQRFVDKGCANFVSVYAPNGFGKTSLFDAIEFGMTSNIRRLKLSNFSENMKYENKLSDFSSFIHNKKMPGENIHIRLELEGYKKGVVDRVITREEEQGLLTGEGENKFFSEAILSQDWFSEFLAVNNAETRFKLFMENFHESQDLLEYHSQLKSIQRSLGVEKGKLVKELNNLKRDLQNDVDEHIMERLDKMVADLSELNIKVDWKQKIDSESLTKLEMEAEQITARETKEKNQADEALGNSEKLNNGHEDLVAVNQIAEHLKTIDTIGKQIDDIKQKLNAIYRLKELKTLLGNLGAERKRYANNLSRLLILVEKYPQYKQMRTIIDGKTNEIIVCDNELRSLAEQISNYEKARGEQEDARQKQKGLLATVENKLIRLEEEYAKYQNCLKVIEQKQKEKAELTEKMAAQKLIIDAKSKRLDHLRDIQQKVYERNVNVEIEGFEELSKNIVTLSQNIQKRNAEINELTQTIEQQIAYQDQVGQLVNRSREIVGGLKTGVCPLCGHDYLSLEQLLKSIEENKAIKTVIAQALARREELNEINKCDQKKRENSYKAFENAIDESVRNATQGLSVLDSEQEKMDVSLRETDKTIRMNQEQVDGAFAEFKGLTKEQVEKQFVESKKKIEVIIQEKDNLIEGYNKTLGILYGQHKSKDAQRTEAQKVISETQNKEEYIEYQRLLGSDSVDEGTFVEWGAQITELKGTIAKYDNQIVDATEEVRKLEEEQHTDLSNEALLQEELSKKTNEKETLKERYYRTIQFIKTECGVAGVDYEKSPDEIASLFEEAKNKHFNVSSLGDKKLFYLAKYLMMLGVARKYNRQQQIKKNIKEAQDRIKKKESEQTAVAEEIQRLQKYLEDYVKNFFQVERIQQLYNTIDPHPEYKEIKFDCDFSLSKPRLNVYMQNRSTGNDAIVPTLYFSTAQINILSFCIFMAKALFAKTDDGQDVGCVFIDDPIQALDDINILSMIDLLRNVAFSLDRQIVLTTHDLNFFELLQKKIPQTKFNSCFLKLTGRGRFAMVGNNRAETVNV